jgi:hypothetical protein
LAQLAEAFYYASDTRRDVWDFAVERDRLLATGLAPNDLRWLICKGYVLHAREVTRPGKEGRQFHPARGLIFAERSCFVLTGAGAAFAAFLGNETARLRRRFPDLAISHDVVPAELPTPRWDGDRRELRLNGRLVKRFKVASPNQETILAVFQEEGWPPRIDDPLPPLPEQDPKRRLHDTIKCLNRHQKNRLIRIIGDGTGKGVRWERAHGNGDGER